MDNRLVLGKLGFAHDALTVPSITPDGFAFDLQAADKQWVPRTLNVRTLASVGVVDFLLHSAL